VILYLFCGVHSFEGFAILGLLLENSKNHSNTDYEYNAVRSFGTVYIPAVPSDGNNKAGIGDSSAFGGFTTSNHINS
jgi:hypothetical protein